MIDPSKFQTPGLIDKSILIPRTPASAYTQNIPNPLDSRLALDDPRQKFNDCHDVESWMAVIRKIIDQTWVKEAAPGAKIEFTHDYSLIGDDPNKLDGVIVVYETLSKIPAVWSKHQSKSISEIKPKIREVRNSTGQTLGTGNGPSLNSIISNHGTNIEIIWAQSFDIIQLFTVYADTWTRMYDYLERFEDLMVTYAGIFVQGGLQQFSFRSASRDALYNPDKTQALPNRTLYYNARIERQTKVNVQTIQDILINAGIINQITGTVENELLEDIIGSIASPSPIEAGPNAE